MSDFWTGFVLGWVAGVLVTGLGPRFVIWQIQKYYALRDRQRAASAERPNSRQDDGARDRFNDAE